MKRRNIFAKVPEGGGDKNNRLTKNERLTLIISISALLVSLGQLIFNSQFFIDIFIKPNLYASSKYSPLNENKIISTFRIQNNGNKTAENLTVSFTCFKDDSYTIVPSNIFDVTETKNGEPLKDVIIRAQTFVPSDIILVVVETDAINFNKFNKEITSQNENSKNFHIPNLNFVKFKDNFARIERLPRDIK